MKRSFSIALLLALCFALLAAAAPEEKSPKPQYDAKGNLLLPPIIATGNFSPPDMA